MSHILKRHQAMLIQVMLSFISIKQSISVQCSSCWGSCDLVVRPATAHVIFQAPSALLPRMKPDMLQMEDSLDGGPPSVGSGDTAPPVAVTTPVSSKKVSAPVHSSVLIYFCFVLLQWCAVWLKMHVGCNCLFLFRRNPINYCACAWKLNFDLFKREFFF